MGNSVYGIIFSILFIALLLIAYFIRSKYSKENIKHYDERQNMIRGKGYELSFFTVILLNMFYSCFLFGFTKDIVSPQFVVMAIVFIGILVYTVFCIWNDAYVQVGQKMTRWIALIVLVIIINGYCAVKDGRERGLLVNGFATGSSVNALIAITFSLILIAYFIKLAINKIGDANEKS